MLEEGIAQVVVLSIKIGIAVRFCNLDRLAQYCHLTWRVMKYSNEAVGAIHWPPRCHHVAGAGRYPSPGCRPRRCHRSTSPPLRSSSSSQRQPRDGRNQRREPARAIPRQDRQRDRNDLAKRCRPDPHRPAIRSSRTVCTAAWVPIVPRISSPSATRLTERANCRASSPTKFQADAVPHNPRYKQKNRHHCQNDSDIPPYCRQPAQRLPRGPVLALVNEAGVVAQAVAGSLRVAWVR
jgi:hypothetical protein